MRRAAKRDDNEPPIVVALRQLGAAVWIQSEPCDLIVGWRGRVYLMEVKNDETNARAKGGELRTPKQIRTAETWGDYITEVRNVTDAFRAIGAEVGCTDCKGDSDG